jgi:hypothetical protein
VRKAQDVWKSLLLCAEQESLFLCSECSVVHRARVTVAMQRVLCCTPSGVVAVIQQVLLYTERGCCCSASVVVVADYSLCGAPDDSVGVSMSAPVSLSVGMCTRCPHRAPALQLKHEMDFRAKAAEASFTSVYVTSLPLPLPPQPPTHPHTHIHALHANPPPPTTSACHAGTDTHTPTCMPCMRLLLPPPPKATTERKQDTPSHPSHAHNTTPRSHPRYVFPGQRLGLELQAADHGVNAVIADWSRENLPKTCWNLSRGDIVRPPELPDQRHAHALSPYPLPPPPHTHPPIQHRHTHV